MSTRKAGDIDILAYRIFREFSRMEYALKATRFFKPNKRNAEPDWTAFARSIENTFSQISDTQLLKAMSYFDEYPPKKQVIEDGVLAWCSRPPQGSSAEDFYIQCVKRVRNNLFHGGKFNGVWFAPERSEILLRHSLTILKASRRVSPTVHEAYKSQ